MGPEWGFTQEDYLLNFTLVYLGKGRFLSVQPKLPWKPIPQD